MIREDYEERERQYLSPYACLSAETRGRVRPLTPCEIRTEFQRDRDKILHSNSFRRLKDKTQVFLSPLGDHYRTRLTHTLEVSQIARTIARALRMNEDLTEAIALGHDLGHTPFGHAGERALNRLRPYGFRHTIQSVRVVDHIENNGKGLNLTYEVKNGIACHSDHVPEAQPLEGRIVRIADKVAYINHDIEDAIRGGVLTESDLPYDCVYVLGRTKSARLTTIIKSVVENSSDDIRMSREVFLAHSRLKAFMFEMVYTNSNAKEEEERAEGIVQALFEHYCRHPHQLPILYRRMAEEYGTESAVCDYVAGMTDQFAVDCFKGLYVPKFWTR